MARYESVKECSAAENIPVAILKEARKYVPQCFNHMRVVNIEILREYVSTHREELEDEVSETLDSLKKERLRNTIIKEKYQLEIIKNKYIDRECSLKCITDIENSKKIIFKNALMEELPPRLVGLSQVDITIECEKLFNKICNEIQGIKL